MPALIALLGGVRGTVFASLAAAALAWGAWQGWQVQRWQDKAGAAQRELQEESERVAGFRALLVQVNAEADRQIADARQREADALAAVAQAQAIAASGAAKLAEAHKALQEAKADPTCAEQLRIELCPAIPLQ